MTLWFTLALITLASCCILLTTTKAKRQIVVLFTLFPLLTFAAYLSIGEPSFKAQPPPPPILSMLTRAEEHLAKTPDDIRGWKAVAPIYSGLEQHDKLIKARREILRLEGENEENTLDLAESLIIKNNGRSDTESLALLRKYPQNTRAAYYLALALDQIGERDKAISAIKVLIQRANDQEKVFLEQEIERLSKK